jgi:hypothetical protein
VSSRTRLADLGIELTFEISPLLRFFPTFFNPRNRIGIGITSSWIEDYPDGGGSFPALFGASGRETGNNTALLGATPAQLRAWGYATTSVPSVDDRIQMCSQRRGVARTACWTELDQYLMTEVVPWVPYMISESSVAVSERVVAYSFDQFAALPALDRIALAPGSQ